MRSEQRTTTGTRYGLLHRLYRKFLFKTSTQSLGMFVLKPAGYDEGFQRDLASKYDAWARLVIDKKKDKNREVALRSHSSWPIANYAV